ncbi:hypothetical protein FHETE_6979 [Fusarium heterosporum]|uniref:Uncharacterized protein n=1 Tax=Fusarium heterosporum TaxID=42747 RepID=A0A8H5T7Z1_FUSHE|nr:hypothetical protein FHETE_6979 [Fusarium heterosporum]
MSNTPTNYSRIAICTTSDVDKLYPLLKSYVQHPSSAKTVSEIAIDRYRWSSRSSFPFFFAPQPPPTKKREATDALAKDQIRDEAHVALQEYIRGLALDQDTTANFINAMDQKQLEVINGDEPDQANRIKFATAAIALLFSLCENITTLYLAESLDRTFLFEYMLKTNYAEIKKPGLQKLKHLRFIPGCDSDPRNYTTLEILRYMQSVHRLPALETVSMDAMQEYQANSQFFVPRTGNMKKLEMTHCDVSGDYLVRIIAAPKALQELKLSMGGLWHTDGGSPMVTASEIGKALAAHKDTLRVLDVDLDKAIYKRDKRREEQYDYDTDEKNAMRPRRGQPVTNVDRIASDKATSVSLKYISEDARGYGFTIGPFHDFPHLRHLSISILTFFGPWNEYVPPFHLSTPAPFRLIDALPSSLEYLCIYGYTRGMSPDVDGHIDEFLAKKDEKLPKLTVVEGIKNCVPSLKDIYGSSDKMKEEDLYQPQRMRTGWVEVSQDEEML